jgi:hypothetical protein
MEMEATSAAELVPSGMVEPRQLVWFADALAKAQANRLATGARIAVVARGPDAEAGAGQPLTDVEALLTGIREGTTEGPIPILARTYRRQWMLEQQMSRALLKRLQTHPAWPWLGQVRGAEPVLLARLLARLDPVRASTPSSFWAYCGFATVPGVEFRCTSCGYVAATALSAPPPVAHRRDGGRKPCRGMLQRVRGPEQGVRVAQPKAGENGRGEYDRVAKALCYQIGGELLRAGGAYARMYGEERRRLDQERAQWPSPRKHMTALRKMEKQFLSHLWLVWREALDLPLTQPYTPANQPTTAVVSPWEMIDARSSTDAGPLRLRNAARSAGGSARAIVEGAA